MSQTLRNCSVLDLTLFLCIVDDIFERYDNLSKSVSDRNEKLQITLTRSMSVQDGLDEMMGWMEGVEASVKEKEQIPLDSASIGDLLSKEAVGFFTYFTLPVADFLQLIYVYLFKLCCAFFSKGVGARHSKSPEQHLSHESQGGEVCGDG